MAGTKAGGLKAAAKNLQSDPNFYRKIGKSGGKRSRTGGLFGRPDLARAIGSIGGTKSKRGYRLIKETATSRIYIDLITNKEVQFPRSATLDNHKRSAKVQDI